MKRTALNLALLSALSLPLGPLYSAPAQAASSTFVRELEGMREYTLSNGLKVILVENHAAPVVSVMVVYRVGSRNEAVGYTGATHFLEHMLFKGTPTYNKQKGTQIAKLLLAQGARFNATTWLDRTNYFETLPADQLDLALNIEADRMRNSFVSDADRKSEMTVVRNELERGENNPDRIMWLNLLANAFMAHPYHHPTIGWRSDVEGVPTERLQKFYQDFYHPNNASLILVGDFKSADALKKIEKTFGQIKASEKPIPKVYTQEPPQQGERRFTLRRPGQLGIVNMGFHVPPLEHKDSAALDILDGLLSMGVSSRLHQALVEKGLAVNVSSFNAQLRDPGLFTLTAKLASDAKHSHVESVMLKELEELQAMAPDQEELERVKNQLLARFAFNRHGTYELASTLGEYEASADWRYMLSYPERLKAVTPADVQRVARRYFVDHNRTVGHFIPEKVEAVQVQERNLSYPQGAQVPSPAQASTQQTPLQRLSFGRNGRLIVQENQIDDTVAFRAALRAGSINDPRGMAGLAELTANMLERGTTQRDKLTLAKELESMGSEITFAADRERVEVFGQMLGQHSQETLALFLEMLQSPAFEMSEFKKLKQQTLDRLRQRLDNTDAMAREKLYAALYPAEHPLALSTADKIQQMEKIRLEDVKDFYQRHYGSNQMILSVVGKVKAQAVQQQLQQGLKGWNDKNPEEIVIPNLTRPDADQRVSTLMKDKANVSIAMGIPSDITLTHPDYFAASLANHALGQSSLTSRLGLRVRDELGLTYGIFSYFPDVGVGAGPWLVGVTTNPKNVETTIKEAKAVIAKYRREGISKEEFELAKSSMIGSYLVRTTTHPQLARRLTDAAFYGLGDNYIQDRARRIRAVTQEQVNAAIRKYFREDDLTVSVAGTYEQ